jgi:hypothetical protein
MISEFCVAFERKSRSIRSLHKLGRRVTKNPDHPELFLNVTNKWFALIAGFFVGLGGGDTGWMQCLPAEWTKTAAPANDAVQSAIPDDTQTWGSELHSIKEGKDDTQESEDSENIICWSRSKLIFLIRLVISSPAKLMPPDTKFRFKSISIKRRISKSGIKKRKGHYNLSKREMIRIKNWFTDLVDNIVEALDSMGKKIFHGAQEAYRFIANGVVKTVEWIKDMVHTVIMQGPHEVIIFFDQMKARIVKFRDMIFAFFHGPLWAKIMQIYECVKSAINFVSTIKEIIENVIFKVTTIISSVALGPIGLLPIADIILSLLCNWNKFAKAIDFFKAASDQTNPITKYEQWGKGVGGLIFAIGSSQTIKTTYTTPDEKATVRP